MFLILSAALLANSSVTSVSSTKIEGEGSTHSIIQTTVNGNTTTVESNEPGTIRVEKTDTGETINSDNPVTVTHSPSEPTPTATDESEPTVTATHSSPEKNYPVNTMSFLKTFLRNLWDRVKSVISFGLLTRK